MDKIGRILWTWLYLNTRPLPQNRQQWLGTLLLLCVVGFSVQVAGAILSPFTHLLVFASLILSVVLSFIFKWFDQGIRLWSFYCIIAAVLPYWLSVFLSPQALIAGVIFFEFIGSKEYAAAVEKIPETGNDSMFFQVILPGPVLSYPWIWFSGGVDWWLALPILGFVFSAIRIFKEQILNWWDSRQDPHRPV